MSRSREHEPRPERPREATSPHEAEATSPARDVNHGASGEPAEPGRDSGRGSEETRRTNA